MKYKQNQIFIVPQVLLHDAIQIRFKTLKIDRPKDQRDNYGFFLFMNRKVLK